MEKQRGSWGSNIGFILAAAGSAVGLGNIWKFPGKAYENGGGAFLVVYIAIVFLIGASVMLAEFVLGRSTQKNAVGAFKATHPRWKFVGSMGVITGFLIMCYYGVIGGWTLKYFFSYLFESSQIFADSAGYYSSFLLDPMFGLLWHLLFMAMTAGVLYFGVSKGIERVSKVLMPALFIILIILAIRSVTLPGAEEGVAHMLSFDFASLTGGNIMAALAQAFFSLSLGMGVMCTYGSYLNKKENLVRNTFTICGLDTFVALMAGFAVIPAIFASHVAPGEGGSFVFVSLAHVFSNMPGGMFFGALFYLLLFFAAITSAISMMEGTVAYLVEEKKKRRKSCVFVLSGILFLVGVVYSLSVSGALPWRGIWVDAAGISYPPLHDFLEFFIDKLLIPVGSLLFCIFVGWIWGPKNSRMELEQGGNRFALFPIWNAMVRYVCPTAIFLIFLGEFGMLG